MRAYLTFVGPGTFALPSPGFCESVVGAVDDDDPLLMPPEDDPVVPAALPPAVPGVPCVLVVPVGVPELSDGDVVDAPMPVPLDDVSPGVGVDRAPPGLPPDVPLPDVPLLDMPLLDMPLPEVPLPVAVLLPVVDVVDGLDIDESVLGWSPLLQAPSAARVAAIATHLIELRMFSPR